MKIVVFLAALFSLAGCASSQFTAESLIAMIDPGTIRDQAAFQTDVKICMEEGTEAARRARGESAMMPVTETGRLIGRAAVWFFIPFDIDKGHTPYAKVDPPGQSAELAAGNCMERKGYGVNWRR